MAPLVAIFNPQADRGRNAGHAELLRERLSVGGAVDVVPTTHRGHAVELAREAARAGARAVVAIGGDGTVHEVVNGLLQVDAAQRPPMGVLAAGSGNDFAYAVGLPNEPAAAIDVIGGGATRRIDAARIEAVGLGAEGIEPRYWVNNVGMLLDGQVNLASHRIRWPRGPGLYLRAALEQLLRPLPCAELHGRFDETERTSRAVVFSLGNGPRSGGKFLLTPAARIDDGLIDYVLVPPQSRWQLLRLLSAAIRGKLPEHRAAEQGQFRSLDLESSIPLAAHVDGEPWLRPEQGVRACRVRILPGALEVLAGGSD